ncbi:MAG: hypothetical protein EON57_07775, partial [Alphaproteobacteria bacterium]
MRMRMRYRDPVILALMLAFSSVSAEAQITVLDSAQDQVQSGQSTPETPITEPASVAASSPCGTQPMTIARMSWPSAAVVAEIHTRILNQELGCQARVIPGDLAATASSMGSTGQPAVAPEMWVTRIAAVWNGAVEAQMVRSVAPAFADTTVE